MRNSALYTLLVFVSILVVACGHDHDQHAHDHTHDTALANDIEVLKVENLLRDSLALAPDVEVIVSYLEVPTEAELAKHYHPGEEFVYVLEGEGDLTIKGETITLKKGDLYKIPIREVHSFKTNDSQARAVVFRVHEKGQPDRIMVD